MTEGLGPKPPFRVSRERVLEVIELLAKGVCEYYHDPTCKKPLTVCDCKYGGRNIMANVRNLPDEQRRELGLLPGEQTGCPELRLVGFIMQNMTAEEFKTILERGDTVRTRR